MPRPAPLPSPQAAKHTLANRFTRLADRVRQLNTRFGLRSRRVFLVWTKWTGAVRGEGNEKVINVVELLPTPKVSDLTAISRNVMAQGTVPTGSIRVEQISAGAFTEDQLRGLTIPGISPMAPNGTIGAPVNPVGLNRNSNPRIDFWYEVVEDGRGDNPAFRQRYRLLNGPTRQEGRLQWVVGLERASEERDRLGIPQIDLDEALES